MAKVTVNKVAPPPPPPNTYTLELSDEEFREVRAYLNDFAAPGSYAHNVYVAMGKAR